MKNTKIKGILFSTLLITTLAGCKKDFLDRRPLGQYTADDISQITDGGAFDSYVFGVYGVLREQNVAGGGTPWLAVESFRSDDAEKGSETGDDAGAEAFYDKFQYNSSDNKLLDYWKGQYKLISYANNALASIASADEAAQAQPQAIVNKAELKFLRAYGYFNLVRAFGDVPKIDFKVTDISQANVPKSSIDEIYTLIDSDLQEAVTNLPLSWDAKYIGRLTKGAAQSLQAKTFLYRKRWTDALAAARNVINSGIYDLKTPYGKIFTDAGENCSESVFEVQAYYTNTQDYGTMYATTQGARGTLNLGWGWNTPTLTLENAYEGGDPRKNATLLYTGGVDATYGEFIPAGARKYWNKKAYTDPAMRASKKSNFGQWVNVRIIRYADVVLMAAEAANEVGGSQNINEALNYIEMIRDRARGGNSSVLPKVTTVDQATLRARIKQERRVELGMENQRFYDLVRWGDAPTVLGTLGYQNKHRFLPIPQTEIDKSGGKLVQNPEW